MRELFLDKLHDFDLVILDRFQNRGMLPLPYIANIVDHVRDGGALLLSVGPEVFGVTSLAATPIGQVLPGIPAPYNAVVEGQFRPQITDLGQRHPVAQGLSGANPPGNSDARPEWGSWYRRIQTIDMHGEVLMSSADGQPLLALDRAGKGRVALLLSDQIWLWSRGHQGGGPQAELLRRVAHWLMQEPELEENGLTARVAGGRLTIERRSIDPAPPGQVTVTGPDGKTQTLALKNTAPGRATAALPAPAPGVWQTSDGTFTAYAAVGAANPLELSDLRATAALVGKIARASGGGVYWLDSGTPGATPEVPELRRTEPGRGVSGSSWIGLERRHDHLVTGFASLVLMPAWIGLPIILGLLVLAWRREGT